MSGLGNKIFDISTITSSVLANEDQIAGGKVTFYGLASEGSKLLYYLGMFNLHNTFKKIINSIWIAPPKCPTCDGTGSVGDELCPQCNGYKYSGENASRGIALNKGYDVRISRTSFSSYPLTEDEWAVVWKFINKAWTQKWWCTPTKGEIKRMFGHFYNVGQDAIRITERFHFSMPQWNISLPREGSFGSPFEAGDVDLMRFIAESVTPAGVNVFVGFYDIQYLGNTDSLLDTVFAFVGDQHPISKKIWWSGFGQYHGLWNQRFRFWNGWCECTDNFEGNLSNWNESGVVAIQNTNDIGRHWCRLEDNSAITTVTGLNIGNPTGVLEIWVHPCDTDLRIGAYLTGVDLWAFYVDFQDGGFYDHNGVLIRPANFNNDYHLRIDFISTIYSKYYYGSGGFNYETVGTSGTSIAWVDAATLYDGACEIVAEWQNHKNILRLQDDATAGEDPSIYHNITQATAGIFECYMGTNDVTENWRFQFREDGTLIIFIYVAASKLYYVDSLGGSHEIQAIANDTLYHVKVVWRADNTFDCYIDSVKRVDDQATRNNQTSGISLIRFWCQGDSADYLYIDAPGLVGEVDPEGITYIEGRNYTMGYISDILVNRESVANTIPFLNSMAPGRPVRIESAGTGYGFVDNFGGNWIPDYEANDNWQRLYPWGWGKNHSNCLSGVVNLYEKYFRNDKVFIGSTGVCV